MLNLIKTHNHLADYKPTHYLAAYFNSKAETS